MKNNLGKVITGLMIATALLGFAAVFPIYAANGATVFVDPKDNTFPPPTMGVGSTFTLNVSIANITGLAGLSFKLSWDKTLLNCTKIEEILFHTMVPSDSYDNIWSLSLKYNNAIGLAEYAQLFQDSAKAVDAGYAPINIGQANFPPEGKLAAARLTFKILMAPGVDQTLTCALHLSEVKPGDLQANQIPVTVVDGTYTLIYQAAPPPTTKPFFSVDPSIYEASTLGVEFNISIKVNNLDAGWKAVGFEFKLSYDKTMLNIQKAYEGPWLPTFGASPNQGTLFMTVKGSIDATFGFIQVGDVVMPDSNGTWHEPFPSTAIPGSEVLAIIQFNATRESVFPESLTSLLHLYDTKVGDTKGKTITQDPSVDGSYIFIPGRAPGASIDIFTQYPAPYGGQGYHKPSDMFWPQKPVCLYANVTYRGWPEQNKDVAFQIIDPHNNTWGVIYARTNANGIANANFTLAWPCDDPEYYFSNATNKWKVVGTVDIACMIVEDSLEFHYDYMVRIWKVTTDKASYKHNDTITVTIEFGSHLQASKNVTVAVTALDETGVPFNVNNLQLQIGQAFQQYNVTLIGGAAFCQYNNSTVRITMKVPKWARAGEATIMVGILDAWPFAGGIVQSGAYNAKTGKWLPYAVAKPPVGNFVDIEAA